MVADLEAGVGTLSRLEKDHVDYILIIAEPTEKSLQVARRAVKMAHEHNVGQIIVLANRIHEGAHLGILKDTFAGEEILVIPYDRAIEDADRHGVAPIDFAPDSPGVKAFESVVQRLTISLSE